MAWHFLSPSISSPPPPPAAAAQRYYSTSRIHNASSSLKFRRRSSVRPLDQGAESFKNMHYRTRTVSLLLGSVLAWPFRGAKLSFAEEAEQQHDHGAPLAPDGEEEAAYGILFADPMMTRGENTTSNGGVRVLSFQQQHSCTLGYVDCVNGFVRNATTSSTTVITCEAACQGSCCVGPKSCEGFTGKVCRDGSCQGILACTNAKIPIVISGCQQNNACTNAGREQGSVESVVNSCSGIMACYQLGYNEGRVGDVYSSCNNNFACDTAGREGSIGHIVSSCNAYKACYHAGRGPSGDIFPSNINSCCNIGSECMFATHQSLPAQCQQVRTKKSHGVFSPSYFRGSSHQHIIYLSSTIDFYRR